MIRMKYEKCPSPKNGFRCIQYIDKENILQAVLEPVKSTEVREAVGLDTPFIASKWMAIWHS
jgi:hypothetical protein